MGTVHGVSFKYIALSAISGVAAHLATDAEALARSKPRVLLVLLLWWASLVNGAISVCFNLEKFMWIVGKDPQTGAVPLWSYLLFSVFHLPTFLYTRLHGWKDRSTGIAVADEVEIGWWVGGRYGADLNKNWAGTIDMTCEFPEGCAKTTARYLLLRCWDGVPPTPEELDQAATFGVECRKQGDVMVHCAHGRGRSTTVMCACLVKAGLHPSWEAAFVAIKQKRAVVKLNKSMRAALTKWQAEYVGKRQ